MNLYLIGDSWTFGAGTWLNELNLTRMEKRAYRVRHRYATVLKNLLDIEQIIDYSYPGRSNEAMVRDVKRATAACNDNDLICIGLTSPYRLSMYIEELDEYMDLAYADDIIQDEMYYNTTSLKQVKNVDRLVKEMKQLVVQYTDEMILDAYKKHVNEIRFELDSKQAKHVVFSAFTPIGDVTDSRNVCFYPYSALQCMPDNVDKLKGKNTNTPDFSSVFTDSSGHPNIRGHQFIATELYKYITEQGILND
jgi:hypothetical protein